MPYNLYRVDVHLWHVDYPGLLKECGYYGKDSTIRRPCGRQTST